MRPSSSRNRSYLYLVGLAGAPLAAIITIAACGGDRTVPCDTGAQLVDGECTPISRDGGSDVDPDTGSDAAPDAPADAAPQDPDLHFSGVTSVSPASAQSLLITWAPATDPFTLPGEMVYDVYLATKSRGQELDQAAQASIIGATSLVVDGLVTGKTYYVIVRATNHAQLQDTNTTERSAKAQADTTPPVLPGSPTVVPRLGCRSRVSWSAATDDLTAPPGITYHVYLADSPVDLKTQSPLAKTLGETTIDVAVPTTTTPYHSFLVVAEDAAGHRSISTQVGTPAPAALKFTESIQPILSTSCAPSCHTVNTTNKFTPAMDEGYAFDTLVGVPGAPTYASICKVGNGFCGPDPVVAGCAGWIPSGDADAGPVKYPFVTATEPECSILYQVVNQNKMPPAKQGVPPPSACDKTLIHDWIEHGAQQ